MQIRVAVVALVKLFFFFFLIKNNCLAHGSCTITNSVWFSLGSGTRQGERNRPSIMSWRDGRDSCTCSCTLTGLPAQIPTELRRGSANKTQTVILEVPTCLTPHILTSSPRPTNSNNYNLLLLTTITYYYLLLTTNYQHSYRNLLKYISPFFNSPPPPHYYIILLYNYYIHSYCYTTLCCMFSPRLGVLGRYIYII